MNRKAIIVDLDGTLCDCEHRRHFVELKDWKSFYQNLVTDPIHEWCASIIRRFVVDHAIILVTGRPEEYRAATRAWLCEHGIPFHLLFMRADGDYRKDCVVKEEIYLAYIKPGYQVSFCVDDRQQVVDMWRKNGLTCLQCADGQF